MSAASPLPLPAAQHPPPPGSPRSGGAGRSPIVGLLRFSVRHPWWIVTATAVLTGLACLTAGRVQLRLDARSLIPSGGPAMARSDAAMARFGGHDVVILAVADERRGIYHPAALALLRAVSGELARTPGIVPGSVRSLATMPRLFLEGDALDLRPWLDRGLPLDAALARRIGEETRFAGLDDGLLAATDGRAAAVYAEVTREADRPRLGALIQSLIQRLAPGGERRPAAAGGAPAGAAGLALYCSGTVMVQAVLGDSTLRDLVRLVPLVVLVLGSLMVLIFRHPAPPLASLTEVGISLVWTVGVMGLNRESVFITTLILPVILIVIGATDDVYALTRCFVELRRAPWRPVPEVVIETFSLVATPIRMTATATMAGLLSSAVIGLGPQRVFGVYGALSVFFSTVFTFTLLPALLVLIDPRPRPGPTPFTRHVQRGLERMLRRLQAIGRRRIGVAAAALAAAALALAAARLRIEDNWVRNLPPRSATVRGDRAINRLLAGTNTVDLLLDSGRPQGFLAPEMLMALGGVERDLAASPLVGAVAGAYGDVVRVNAALAATGFRTYRDRLERGERRLSRGEIEQAQMLLASAGQSQILTHLDAEGRTARMTAFLRAANYSRTGAVLAAASSSVRRHLGPAVSATPFGDGWIGYLTVRALVAGQVWSIVISVGADLLLLLLIFRSLRTALVALLPVTLAVLVVFASLAATGTPLGTANSLFACITLGIGVDYSIHLVAFCRRARLHGVPRPAAGPLGVLPSAAGPLGPLPSAAGPLGAAPAPPPAAGRPVDPAISWAVAGTGPAILTSAIAIVAGFAVLLFSAVPPNRELGLLVCFTMALCAVMTLVLAPSLLLAPGGEP